MVLDSLIPQTQIHALALSFLPDCSVDSDSILCKLPGLLHLLYVLAAVLAVVLLIVIVFAINAWRSGRNSQEIPDSLSKRERNHD